MARPQVRVLRAFERDAGAAVAQLAGARTEQRQREIREAALYPEGAQLTGICRVEVYDEDYATGCDRRVGWEGETDPPIEPPRAFGILERDRGGGRVEEFNEFVLGVVVCG